MEEKSSNNNGVKKIKKRTLKNPPLIPKKDENQFLEIMRGLSDNIRMLCDNTIELNAQLEQKCNQDELNREMINDLKERLILLNDAITSGQIKQYEKIIDWILRISMITVFFILGVRYSVGLIT